VVEFPEHIVGGAERVTVGVVFTVTIMLWAVLVHVPVVPVTE
jgi:hypothetical protein